MIGGGGGSHPPRLCLFGTYARDYTVTRLLRAAAEAAGYEVVECHRPLWEHTRTKRPEYFRARSAMGLMCAWAIRAAALVRLRRGVQPVAAYLVGFNGQFDAVLLRWLLGRHCQPPIVFAPLVTLTETLVEDRALFGPRTLRAAAARWVDRASLAAATRIVIDTEAHRAYLAEMFHLPAARSAVWHLGADATVFSAQPAHSHGGPVRVLHYGSFLPLHGVSAIVDAAALLASAADIEFEIVGEGPDPVADRARDRGLAPTRIHFTPWVPYHELGRLVAAADICLGIFGTTRKAQMVIPNKLYQAAAVGRAIITADTPAVREVFTHGETAWLCAPGAPDALADAIRLLAGDGALRLRLGRQAAALMAERFSAARQAARLRDIFTDAESAVAPGSLGMGAAQR